MAAKVEGPFLKGCTDSPHKAGVRMAFKRELCLWGVDGEGRGDPIGMENAGY